ncbi:hypothetical protein DdX_11767 [Ditylenchus destructor]|uniref:DUF4773 domain-containing protein n=1 Tax=Ditylenchus destructor TaxID=166010 RepID=A0AAD4R4D4_9BILA|nr:hypothetical protein DdX_11767 [Ditylenchus destructor]
MRLFSSILFVYFAFVFDLRHASSSLKNKQVESISLQLCNCDIGSCECRLDIEVSGHHITASANVTVTNPDRLVNLTLCVLDKCTHKIAMNQQPLCNKVDSALEVCVAMKDLELTETEVSGYLQFKGKVALLHFGPVDTDRVTIKFPQKLLLV